MSSHPTLYQIILTTKQVYLDLFSPVLDDICETVSFVEIEDPQAEWDSEDWYIEGHALETPNEDALKLQIALIAKSNNIPEPTISIEPLKETNWLEEMWQQFKPIDVAGFFIKSSYYQGEIPEGAIPITLDAATAFGSGEHGTTAGCLTALKELHQTFKWKNPLDLGCGSGILAIAAAKLHPVTTLAIDNDAEAVRVTSNNANINDVGPLIKAQVGDGLQDISQTFDLVLANILAKPLISLASDMAKHVETGGFVILSGLLDWQKDDVTEAYLENGFNFVKEFNLNRWITLVLQRA